MKKLAKITVLLFTYILISIDINCQVNTVNQEFEFIFKDHILNGVITTSKDSNIKGIVLIIHGSGYTDAVSGNWYSQIRQAINQAGYSTLMWDKMGCGKSEGVFNYFQTVESSSDEVIAAIGSLKQQKIKGVENIGFWGISRAGWIVPKVMEKYGDITFWISASGVDAKESFPYLFEHNLRIIGIPEDSIQILVEELSDGYRATHQGASYETYLEVTQNLRRNSFWKRFNNGMEVSDSGYYSFQKDFMNVAFDYNANLQIYVENYDTLLLNVRCPVLALFGKLDKHVDWQKTISLYEKTIGQNGKLTCHSFEDCNHNLFKCETGGFYEFEDNNLKWERCDGILDIITDWINMQ